MRTSAANSNLTATPVKTLGDIVTRRHSPSFFENDYIKVILPLLQESDIGAGSVLDDEGRLIGLLTERGILRHIFACASDKLIHDTNIKKYIDDMTVGDAMIREPETLDERLSIEEAAHVMLRRGYRYMPVVSHADRHRPLGIVGERELALHLQQLLQEAKKAEQAHQSLLSYMLCEPYGCGYRFEA